MLLVTAEAVQRIGRDWDQTARFGMVFPNGALVTWQNVQIALASDLCVECFFSRALRTDLAKESFHARFHNDPISAVLWAARVIEEEQFVRPPLVSVPDV